MSWITFNKFITGISTSKSLKIKTLYSTTFKKHRKEDWTATDPLTDHPKPWKWLRVMAFLLVLGIISLINSLLLGVYAFTWLALIGATFVPVVGAVFISETILRDKISAIKAFIIFVIGAVMSLLITGLLSLAINYGDDGLNAVFSAPITEEIAKALVIVATLKILKIKSVSAALFVGWVIGSGFQVAETLGYSSFHGYEGLFSLIQILPGGTDFIFVGTLDYSTIIIRLIFSFGMHAFWGAIHGAAFIFAKRSTDKKFNVGRFSIWFFLCITMHMLWNTLGTYITNFTLALILMIIVQLLYLPLFFYLIDAGLRDYRDSTIDILEDENLKNASLSEKLV